MTDTIVPIPVENEASPINEVISTACLIVAGRLDPEILRAALEKLVGLWPKLGARFVKNKKVRRALITVHMTRDVHKLSRADLISIFPRHSQLPAHHSHSP